MQVEVDDKVLWKPARKLFLNQLKFLTKSGYDTYQILFQNQKIEVVQVWIQAVVLAKGKETMSIEDCTGKAIVTNINHVPKGCNWVEEGKTK